VIATVTAPAINFSSTSIQVGRDLQQQFSVTWVRRRPAR